MNPNFISKTFEGQNLSQILAEMNNWKEKMASQIEEHKIIENPKVNWRAGIPRLADEFKMVNLRITNANTAELKTSLNIRKKEINMQQKMLQVFGAFCDRITEITNGSNTQNPIEVFVLEEQQKPPTEQLPITKPRDDVKPTDKKPID